MAKRMEKAVIFGAGSVGRGFIGPVLSDAGLAITFVDINERIVGILNRDESYLHVTVRNELNKEQTISPVKALHSLDENKVIRAGIEASLLATCVGVRALPAVCRLLGKIIKARIALSVGPINLIIAENLHDAPQKITRWIADSNNGLTADDIQNNLGLVSTSIGRMIPAPEETLISAIPTTIEVEPYDFLPIDAAAAKSPLPLSKNFVIDNNTDFSFYTDRKLYIHNMGHSLCAYIGALLGDTYIWESISRVEVRYFVRNAMVESATALSAHYGKEIAPLLNHIDDLLHRFNNRALKDTVARVGRDPLRKLSEEDRFQGSLKVCASENVPLGHISLGLAAGMQQVAKEVGPSFHAVARQIGLDLLSFSPATLNLIKEQYWALNVGFDADQQIEILNSQFRDSNIP